MMQEIELEPHSQYFGAITKIKVGPKSLTIGSRFKDGQIKFQKRTGYDGETLEICATYQDTVWEDEKCNLGETHRIKKSGEFHMVDITIPWEMVDQLIEWLQLGSWKQVRKQ